MRKAEKGIETDDGFYVQSASVIGNRLDLDFAIDPPPDVVVEVDIHHDSTDNFPIYAAFGVPEIWRYIGMQATILHLHENHYIEFEPSNALPIITSSILTEYLARMRQNGEFAAIIALDEWLQSLQK
jgi:Uma2 family endonuclease